MRAVLCGYYGKGNGGDEALLATLLQLLPSHVHPIVLSGHPEETAQTYGVEACDRMSLPDIIRALRGADAFIWGGGSLMQDATSAASLLYYAGLMSLAQLMGLQTIAWAQGIGPLRRSWTRWLTQQLFSRCTAVSVRDRGSATLLTEWSVPFALAPDPVWALTAEPLPGLWELPAPRVAIALRQHRLLTPARLDTITQALIAFQAATDMFVLLVPFQPLQDLAIAQAIHDRMPKTSTILTVTKPQQLMGLFRGVELTIAMRLHALIMAAAQECRCFALSYDPKVSQLMHDIEIPGWELATLPDDPNPICQTWLQLYANGDPLSQVQIRAISDRALLHRDLLVNTLPNLVL